jgi:hypothetical protein
MSNVKVITPLVVSFGILYFINTKCRNDACKQIMSNLKSSSEEYIKDNRYHLSFS